MTKLKGTLSSNKAACTATRIVVEVAYPDRKERHSVVTDHDGNYVVDLGAVDEPFTAYSKAWPFVGVRDTDEVISNTVAYTPDPNREFIETGLLRYAEAHPYVGNGEYGLYLGLNNWEYASKIYFNDGVYLSDLGGYGRITLFDQNGDLVQTRRQGDPTLRDYQEHENGPFAKGTGRTETGQQYVGYWTPSYGGLLIYREYAEIPHVTHITEVWQFTVEGVLYTYTFPLTEIVFGR